MIIHFDLPFRFPQIWSIAPPPKPPTLAERLSTVASSNLTAWLSPLTSYLDGCASSILPARLHSLIYSLVNTNATPLLKVSAAEPQSPLIDQVNLLLANYTTLSYTTFAATLLALIYLLYSMSSYGRSAFDIGGKTIAIHLCCRRPHIN